MNIKDVNIKDVNIKDEVNSNTAKKIKKMQQNYFSYIYGFFKKNQKMQILNHFVYHL